MSKPNDRSTPAYWERRLFRNTFTYRGRRRTVPGWCIKVQWQGERRTLRLAARDRHEAGREAADLHRLLRAGGWAALDRRRSPTPIPDPAIPELIGVGRRKYVGDLGPARAREWFATLVAQGITEHVPLGTDDPNEARLRAQDLRGELERDGWARFRLSHSREITVAVFWRANPMTCTYTTLLSLPARAGSPEPGPAREHGWRILVLEPDAGVRRALVKALASGAGAARVDDAESAAHAPRSTGWDIILANREQPAATLRDRLAPQPSTPPRLLTHGVFTDSDAIFASFSGVSQGYLLRRVQPAYLMAPLFETLPDGPPRAPLDADRTVVRYFQALLEPASAPPRGHSAEVTSRELEILDLLSRGFADKEVAHELGISIWTVHSHLKRIFAKYGVRTRTEAVVRHLQK